VAKAYVAARCHVGSSRSVNLWTAGWTFNALFGDCGGGDGHDQRVWFFAGQRYVGTDAPGSSAGIIGMWRDEDTIAFLYVLYRKTDALCCPTGGGKIVRFRWTGKRVVALDELPPLTAKQQSSQVARYP
jgi:LppP/LprE lipoprotein